MKKIIIASIVVLVAILISTFILKYKNPTTETYKKIDFMNAKELYVSFTVSSTTAQDIYEITINKEKKEIVQKDYNNEEKRKVELSKKDIEKIKKGLTDYEINKWDGFSGNDLYVLDGEEFSLTLEADGEEVIARGSNKFPTNYKDFKKLIIGFFKD